ncbi:MAG: glycosyltransferase [Candidatus Marinimicrobia bacterium]|nr:glycosyltransferase [Candidatus Neomarinimicrobiota bacterium]
MPESRLQLIKTISGNVSRPFVRFPKGDSEGHIEIQRPEGIAMPLVSIIIPTVGAARNDFLPNLLTQIARQTFRNFETIIVIGDSRQGRAINCGAAVAVGKYLMTFDDDTRLGSDDLIEKMVRIVTDHPEIGMAGVANLVPDDAGWFVRRVMKELPRRTSPIVSEITESDLAEHPCCMIPRELFYKIGGENEMIPRGLDPYLRQEIRRTGFTVVVLPGLFIHHLPPRTFKKFIRQFYRNGRMAAYVNKFYPQFVVELPTQHGEKVREKRPVPIRTISYCWRLLKSILTLKVFYLLSLVLYLAGYLVGFLFLRENDV